MSIQLEMPHTPGAGSQLGKRKPLELVMMGTGSQHSLTRGWCLLAGKVQPGCAKCSLLAAVPWDGSCKREN